jgi:hypothetical protein
MTLFWVVFRQECVLPVELEQESWQVVEWCKVAEAYNARAELIALQARQ